MPEPRRIPRTVKPRRKHLDAYLPIIAVDNGAAYLERTGEVIPLSELPERLRLEPPSYLVAQNFSTILHYLDETLSYDDSWQYRVTPVKRAIFNPSRPEGHRLRTTETVCAYCGFSSFDKKKRGHYHFPLDPLLFTRNPIHGLDDSDLPQMMKLHRWASDVREWAGEQELRVSPSVGGIAAQLLRDERFYPVARRKVPKATNARARGTLPGNYYQLVVKENATTPAATYLDMRSAHHFCASQIAFPHADTLRARGRFRVTDETFTTALGGRLWKAQGSPGYRQLLDGAMGLLLVHLTVPTIGPERFPPPYMLKAGRRLAWIYTNEIPMIRELGGIIDGVEAAWVSFDRDPGLNRYAEWAMAQTALMDTYRKKWAKPVLLATYGILAARPRVQVFGFRRSKGGELRYLPAGADRIPAFVKEGLIEVEPPIANVIHRGMIEAETRMRSLALARELTGHGISVLSIYADSVIVKSGPLPFLPAPWEVKHELTRLRFFNSTSFTSVEMTKLPGIPREGLDHLRRIERLRRIEI